MRDNTGQPRGSASYQVRKLGGGGFVVNLSIANNGDKVVGTDVGGLYRLYSGDTQWVQLLSSTSLPAGDWDIANGIYSSDTKGCYTQRVAYNDSTRIYMCFNGYWYVSSNSGTTFTRTALGVKYLLSNSAANRYFNNKIDVDPQNKDVAILGTSGDGVYLTLDGLATTPTAIAAIPAPTVSRQPHLVACDPNSSVSLGLKQIWYISSWGNGVYQSTTGPAGVFTLMAGSPATQIYMICDTSGNVYVVDGTAGNKNIYKWNGATWAQMTTLKATPFNAIAVEPGNVSNIAVTDQQGFFQRSTDGAATFIGSDVWFDTYPAPIGREILASQVFWLQRSPTNAVYPGAIAFDPSQTNKLYMTHGLGVCYSTPPATFIRWTWSDNSQGIEELVGTRALSIPNNPVTLFGVWDKMMFRSSNPAIYPSTNTGPGSLEFNATWDIDYASNDPSVLVSNTVWIADARVAYSLDGGASWTRFNNQHPDGALPGGCLAVGAKGGSGGINCIYVPGNNGKAVYRKSTDPITDPWRYLPFPGYPTGFGNWVQGTTIYRYIVTADKTVPGTFYILVNNTTQPVGSPDSNYWGVWKTTDEGDNWTRVYANKLDAPSFDYWHGILKCTPNRTGELYYTPGRDYPASPMKYSGDGAVTWTAVPNVLNCRNFGFGKAATGSNYPTIFMEGNVSGVYGLWMSIDNAATWINLGTYALNRIDPINGLTGDMNVFGRYYIGMAGTGYIQGDFVYGMRLAP